MSRRGRRGNGEGTIYKRPDGLWAAQVTLPDGRRATRYGKTQQEVSRKLAALRRDREDGLPVTSERRTLADYLASWLEMRKPSLRPGTLDKYTWHVEQYIVPVIGKVKLAKLTGEHVQRLVAHWLGEGLASSTVRTTHGVLHNALGEAVRLGLIPRNVAELVKKPRAPRREMKCWTPDESRAFLDAARDDRLYALFVVALSTGMREGELLALRWRDVSLDGRDGHGSLRVQHTLHFREGKMCIDEVKTETGRRQIQLSHQATEALREHRRRQLAERMKMGPIWLDYDLVFCNTIGGALRVSAFRRRVFKALVEKAGVPYIRPYDMRHTAATLLLVAGVHPKVVSEMLGHSSVTITLSIYSHVLPMIQRDAAAAMDRLLGS